MVNILINIVTAFLDDRHYTEEEATKIAYQETRNLLRTNTEKVHYNTHSENPQWQQCNNNDYNIPFI